MIGNESSTILLVEDNADDVELTKRAFDAQGIANPLVVAHDGAEAIERLLPEDGSPGLHPSLILLDLNLPRVDGLDVLRAIRADDRTSLIPVIVLTTSEEQQDIVDSYRFGGNSYVRKPIGFDEFGHAVRQLGLYWLVINVPPPAFTNGRRETHA